MCSCLRNPLPFTEPEYYHSVLNSPLSVPSINTVNTINFLTSYFIRSILMLSFHLHLGLSSGLFPSDIPITVSMHFSSIACPNNPTGLNLIYLAIPHHIRSISMQICYWAPALRSKNITYVSIAQYNFRNFLFFKTNISTFYGREVWR